MKAPDRRGPSTGELLSLVRTRLPGALLLALGVALYPRMVPGAAQRPEIGPMAAGGVLALALVRGMVAGELRRGTHILWLQKGGRLEHRYLARLLCVALLTLSAHTLLLLGLLLLDLGPVPSSPGDAASCVLVDLAVLAVGFAVTAAGLPLEPLMALLLILAFGVLGIDAHLVPESLGGWAPWLAAQRFPAVEIRALAHWLDGGPGPSWAAVRVALYPAAWIALGWVALRLRLEAVRRGWPSP